MALASLKNRIRKAQRNTHAGDSLGRIAELISRGAFYDELTPEEREAYKDYKESLGGVADDIAGAELEKCLWTSRKKKPIISRLPGEGNHQRRKNTPSGCGKWKPICKN